MDDPGATWQGGETPVPAPGTACSELRHAAVSFLISFLLNLPQALSFWLPSWEEVGASEWDSEAWLLLSSAPNLSSVGTFPKGKQLSAMPRAVSLQFYYRALFFLRQSCSVAQAGAQCVISAHCHLHLLGSAS